MPELPEVETVCRGLAAGIAGRRLESIEVSDPRLVERSPLPPESLAGGTITSVRRRGKWMICSLRALHGDLFLVMHMRMSGRILVGAAGAPLHPGGSRRQGATPPGPPARATLRFDDGTRVDFVDQRRFGELLAWEQSDVDDLERRLGPEADTVGVRELRARLAGRTGRLKAALCNQSVIAGVGNIYADEALWRARLAWDRPAGSLTPEEGRRLARAVRGVLRRALAAGGTSTRDGLYVSSDGTPGLFAVRLAVYQREGEPCPRCANPVERTKMGSVSVYWCPTCQS